MIDHDRINAALASGADPNMLCTTCPWDRLCVEPPKNTREDVDREVAKAKAEDEKSRMVDGNKGMPTATLMTTMIFSGKDRQGEMCPVFSLRLRSAEGRQIADSIRTLMQGGDVQ
jgi:hypothetical protein